MTEFEEERNAKRNPPSGDVAWHPEIVGWSHGIHDFYRKVAGWLPPAATFVELGVYKGRGLLRMAEHMHDLGKLDARLVGIDPGTYYDGHAELMRNVEAITGTWGERPHVEIRKERGVDAAPLFPDGSVHFVFIDGDHSKAAVYEDIVTWLPKVRAKGILGGHDFGHADIPGVKEAVEQFFGVGRVRVEPGTIWWLEVGT